MKQLVIRQKKIFEIASFLKSILPNHKICIYQSGDRITIEFYSRLERFKLEEVKTLLKIKYPYFQLIFTHKF